MAYTVVYDGDCRVCQRMVQRLAQWDGHQAIEIVASQTPGVRERFPWIAEREYAESLQLVRCADGRTWQGAAAVAELTRVLPRGWLVSWLFRIPFVRALADRLYRWFARNRYRLGCKDHCGPLPSGEARRP